MFYESLIGKCRLTICGGYRDMKRKSFFSIAAVTIILWTLASTGYSETSEHKLYSPDGRACILVGNTNSVNAPTWKVDYDNRVIIDHSGLGFDFKDVSADATKSGYSIELVKRQSSNTTWKPVYGERDIVTDNYNEMILDLVSNYKPSLYMQLQVRAYDEGIGFRYIFPANQKRKEITIEREKTSFCFTADHDAWAVYSAQGIYSKVPLSKIKPNCERPLVVQIKDGPTVAVGEAALTDFARMRLQPLKEKPYAVESMLAGQVKIRTPYETPWRYVMIADTPARLAEQNYFVENLNPPCAIADTSWIKPGKVIREVTLTTEGGKACVDFAKKMNLQYVEYDAGWYGPEGDSKSDATTITLDPKRSSGPLDLHEVIRYANKNDIGILVYVNRRALEKQLGTILPLYKSWGIKGVKYGFVNVGDQKWTRWLHEAVQKAADNQLMVDIHDEYRPTGFSRTYPNLMTQEGIGGNETMPVAEQNLVFPFTRYLCGAADYTICWYTERVKNTLSHQLAGLVVYYSPLQFVFWYDQPKMYRGEPAAEFFKHVPTVWDETTVIQGEIGEYVTIARRSGEQWFVGSMNALKRRRLEIPLTFLEPGRKYTATVYEDSSPDGSNRTGVRIRQLQVDSKSVITADMASNGGQAIQIKP